MRALMRNCSAEQKEGHLLSTHFHIKTQHLTFTGVDFLTSRTFEVAVNRLPKILFNRISTRA